MRLAPEEGRIALQLQQMEPQVNEERPVLHDDQVPTQQLPIEKVRAREIQDIMRIVKGYESVLVRFDAILEKCTRNSEYGMFTKLSKVSDFSDGFVINQGHNSGAAALKAYLKRHFLECLPLRGTKKQGYFFGQQAQGPFTLQFAVTVLQERARDMFHQLSARKQPLVPIVSKFDATRDLRGTFFVADDAFAGTCHQLLRSLEEKFRIKLRVDKNSYSTCLQFEQISDAPGVRKHFKVYNKVVQQFQSEAPQKAVGMNTNALFNP